MASLASTPTANEIVKRYKPIQPESVSFRSRWGNTVSLEEPPWRVVAFSAIADLEGQEPKIVAGLGSLTASAKAANALRGYLLQVTEVSLPLPRLVPATGGAILLTWKSGERSIEIASFPDGDIVLEALDRGVLKEELSEQGLDSAVSWLVRG